MRAQPRDDDDGPEDTEEAIVDDFMGESLRADRLVDLCGALRGRIRGMKTQIAAMPVSPERTELERRLKGARHQLAILQQELAISEFVEESVRATFNAAPHIRMDEEDEE